MHGPAKRGRRRTETCLREEKRGKNHKIRNRQRRIMKNSDEMIYRGKFLIGMVSVIALLSIFVTCSFIHEIVPTSFSSQEAYNTRIFADTSYGGISMRKPMQLTVADEVNVPIYAIIIVGIAVILILVAGIIAIMCLSRKVSKLQYAYQKELEERGKKHMYVDFVSDPPSSVFKKSSNGPTITEPVSPPQVTAPQTHSIASELSDTDVVDPEKAFSSSVDSELDVTPQIERKFSNAPRPAIVDSDSD